MGQPTREDIEELNRISESPMFKLTGARGARQYELTKYFLSNPDTPREIAFSGLTDEAYRHIKERGEEERYSTYVSSKIERRSGAADTLASVGILEELRRGTYVLGDREAAATFTALYERVHS